MTPPPNERPFSTDDLWGRIPGRRPPLPTWAPLIWWAGLAVALIAVVVALVRPPGPLDQSDPARQRDGLLLDGPAVAATVEGVAFGGRPVVLLFDREPPDRQQLATWLDGVPDRAEVRLVLPEDPDWPVGGRPEVVVDPDGVLADAVGLPTPVDGGRGIGYAVVDGQRQVRYSTLDPAYLANAFEVATILRWLP
jgi:hypothetical protein